MKTIVRMDRRMYLKSDGIREDLRALLVVLLRIVEEGFKVPPELSRGSIVLDVLLDLLHGHGVADDLVVVLVVPLAR